MIPSRGLARVSPCLTFPNQIISRTQGRSIPRQARSAPSTRQFGTNLKANGGTFHGAPRTSVSPAGRLGAISILSSQTSFLSSVRQTRFASTGSDPPPAESAAASSSPNPTDSAFTPPELPSDFSSLSELDGASLLNTPETIGYLHNLGLDYGWGPTAMSQWFVEHLHIWGGLSWWASIVGLSILVRLVMAKPALIAQQESVKANKMRKDPVFDSLQEKWKTALTVGGAMPQAELMQLRLQMALVRERFGVKPWKMFLPMLQAPLAFGMFRLATGMAALPVPGFETGGVLWFTDLTAPDPYMILPLVSAIMMYLSMKRSIPFMNPQQAAFMRVLPWVLGPIGFLFTWRMSAYVQVFLASTAILQYVQTTLFHVHWIRRACGLPPLEELKHGGSAGPPKPRTSPFSAAGRMQYQPPRTINTTATENSASAVDSSNPISAFKDAWSGLQDKIHKRAEVSAQKNMQKDAAQYEKRRIQEEHEQYLRRLEAARRNERK